METKETLLPKLGAQPTSCTYRVAFVPDKDGKVCIHIEDIVWIESCGSYSIIHKKDSSKLMVSIPMGKILETLQKNGYSEFLRIHKCYSINMKYVNCKKGNNLQCNDKWLKIGLSYQEDFENRTIDIHR